MFLGKQILRTRTSGELPSSPCSKCLEARERPMPKVYIWETSAEASEQGKKRPWAMCVSGGRKRELRSIPYPLKACHLQTGSFISSFPIRIILISFSCLLALARTFSTMMSRNCESEHLSCS